MLAKVPQFIEVEDKIFGPLTFKQFLYVIGGAAGCFILWTFLPKFVAVLFILPMAGVSLALAFYQVNNRPFIVVLESFIRYQMGSKLYLWNKSAYKTSARGAGGKRSAPIVAPKLSQSRLSELAWSLDVNQSVGETNG